MIWLTQQTDMWQLMLDNDTSNDWLWYLRSIEADKAWDITTSDTSIQIYHGESDGSDTS